MISAVLRLSVMLPAAVAAFLAASCARAAGLDGAVRLSGPVQHAEDLQQRLAETVMESAVTRQAELVISFLAAGVPVTC